MNFKTPFKVLTTAALIGTLAVSTVAPGAASAATNTTVSAKAEVAQDIKSVVLKKGDDSITLSYNDYASAQGSKVLDGYVVTHVVADNGAVYDYETYGLAYSKGATTTEVFKKLADAEASTTEVPAEAKEASFNEDGELVVSTPTEEDFEVTEIAAITTKTVEVSFPALKSEKLGATVEVKDSKGVERAVKAVDLSEGDTSATFAFETEVKEADLVGIWTINGIEYDFDTKAKIAAIVNHADQLKLNDALEAAEIKNVDQELMGAYSTAIKDAEVEPTTLEEIQAIIDKVNAENASASEKEKIVEAVAAAGTNELKLYNALNGKFERVNKEWVSKYAQSINGAAPVAPANTPAAGVLNGKDADSITSANAEELFDDVQAAIDAANAKEVKLAGVEAFNKLTTETVEKARTLANTYLAPAKEGEEDAKAYANATMDLYAALIKVDAATTTTSLKKALTELDELEAKLVESSKATSAPITDEFDIKTVIDANLKDYITAIDTAVVGAKNQRKDIQKLITNANTAAATKLIRAVYNEAAATSVDGTKLIKALKDLGVVQVADTNKDAYVATATATAIKNAAGTLIPAAGPTPEVFTAGTLVAVQKEVDKVNLAQVAAVTSTTPNAAKVIIEKLNVFGLDNVIAANAAQYITDATTIGNISNLGATNEATVKAVKADVKASNDKVAEAKLVAQINKATDAATVKSALDELAITSYVNVPSADKAYIAEKLFAEVKKATTISESSPYASKEEVATALFVAATTTPAPAPATGIIADYNALLTQFVEPSDNIAAQVAALEALEHKAFDDLAPGKKGEAAEYFADNFPTTTDNTGATVDKAYKTLAAVKADLDKAIEATK